jgi:hypothetical protein
MPGKRVPKTRAGLRTRRHHPGAGQGGRHGGAAAAGGVPFAEAYVGPAGRRRAEADAHDRDRLGLSGKKTEKSVEVGKRVAEKAKAAGITKVVFDRGGYQYHGRVKAVAEGAREGGLEF